MVGARRYGDCVTVGLLAVLGRGVVDPGTPVVMADDAGFTRGDGCFEGIRVRAESGAAAADNLDRHFARMARSAAALDLDFDAAAWRDLVLDALAAWDRPGEAAMRLVLTRGVDAPFGLLTITEVAPELHRLRRDGLKVITLSRGFAHDTFAGAPWLLGGIKTLSYAVGMAAQREAERRGCDDVIFADAGGWVLEAPTSSVVWARGRDLRTTPVGASGILAGTTQAVLFERATASGWDCAEEAIQVDALHDTDAVWLVGSVRGPVDVVELDGKTRERRPALDAEIRGLAGFPPSSR